MSNHQQYPNPPHSKTYVTAVSIYGNVPMRTLTLREAVEFIPRNQGKVTCILGSMQPGYLGREVLEVADLERWIAEDDSEAEWQAISDGERFATEAGALR